MLNVNGNKPVMILERSGHDLRTSISGDKIILEGIFAEFGIENRNGRIYDESQYLPHLEYLIEDVRKGTLLGELDHPEDRFDINLQDASHRVLELIYDGAARQVRGKIELLPTPKGNIARTLLECGIPLSISSRAAGEMREDNTVAIDQIFTYDLVCRPGFANAELNRVAESKGYDIGAQKIAKLALTRLNESSAKRLHNNILTKKSRSVNEDIAVIDISDRYDSIPLRDEAKNIIMSAGSTGGYALTSERVNRAESNAYDIFNPGLSPKQEEVAVEDTAPIAKWSAQVVDTMNAVMARMESIENSVNVLKDRTNEISKLKRYVEMMRGIVESAVSNNAVIVDTINDMSEYIDGLASTGNEHLLATSSLQTAVQDISKQVCGEGCLLDNVIDPADLSDVGEDGVSTEPTGFQLGYEEVESEIPYDPNEFVDPADGFEDDIDGDEYASISKDSESTIISKEDLEHMRRDKSLHESVKYVTYRITRKI